MPLQTDLNVMDSTIKPAAKSYPTIAQSMDIAGLLIIARLIMMPVYPLLLSMFGPEWAAVITYLFVTLPCLWIISLMRRRNADTSSIVWSIHSWRIIPAVIAITLALIFGFTIPLGTLIPMPDNFKEMFRTLADQRGAVTFLVVVIAAPVIEELIFRGIMLEGLLKRYTPLKSIIISSLLFGVVHLNPWQFISAFLIGTFSGWVYYRARRLAPSIVIHATANLTGFLTPFFVDKDSIFDDTLLATYGGMINLIVVVVASAIAIWIGVTFLKNEFEKHGV